MSVILKLRAELPLCSFVLVREEVPAVDALRDEIRAWILRCVPEPRRAALLARVGAVALDALPIRELLTPTSRDQIAMWRPGIEERSLMGMARQAVTVRVAGSFATLDEDLALQVASSQALAAALGGVVLDPHDHRLLPVDDRCAAPPDVVPVEQMFRVLSSEDRGRMWVTTIGMGRYGVPELEVCRAPVHLLHDIARVMKRAGAELVTRLRAAGSGSLHLETLAVDDVVFGVRRGKTGLLRLHPPGRPHGDVGPLVAEVAHRTGEEPPPKLVYTDPGDPEIEAFKAASRRELPAVRERFVAGLEPLSRLYLRVAFGEEPDLESMWVCVERFTRHQVRGQLVNQPQLVRLRAGQRVSVPIARVIDWRIDHADGRVEGARLDEVLHRKGEDGPMCPDCRRAAERAHR